MVYELKTDKGRRFVSNDLKVFLKKKNSIVIAKISELRKGDEIAWETERFATEYRDLFYERLNKRDPDLKAWLREYDKIGNYNVTFRDCYDKISDNLPESIDLIDEVSGWMEDHGANASHPATLWSWMSDAECPWLPGEPSDLGILSKSLGSSAKRYHVRGVSRFLERLKMMSEDDHLRELVGWVRGRRRWNGRSIELESEGDRTRKGSSTSRRGKTRRTQKSAGGVDHISEARRLAQYAYEDWLASLPTTTKAKWATVKSPPKSISGRSGEGRTPDSSKKGYRSFDNGPIDAREKGLLKRFGNLLGTKRRKSPSHLGSAFGRPPSKASSERVPPATHQTNVQQPAIAQSVSGDAPAPSSTGQITVISAPTVGSRLEPQIEWTKLGFGLIELRVNTTEAYEWVIPASISFTLLGNSKIAELDCTRQQLEILPRNRTVEIPDSNLIISGSSHPVPGATFEFDLGIPKMGLEDIKGASKELLLASEILLQAGVELRKRNPKGSVYNSLRALKIIRRATPQSIPPNEWNGVDILRGEWESEPRRLVPNLILAEWLFQTALTGLGKAQATEIGESN